MVRPQRRNAVYPGEIVDKLAVRTSMDSGVSKEAYLSKHDSVKAWKHQPCSCIKKKNR